MDIHDLALFIVGAITILALVGASIQNFKEKRSEQMFHGRRDQIGSYDRYLRALDKATRRPIRR